MTYEEVLRAQTILDGSIKQAQALNTENIMPALIDAGFGVVLQGINPPVRPPSLFHFTTIDGLVGIIGSRSLWASIATALNDPSEVIYTVRIADEFLQAGCPSGHQAFCDHVRYYLDPNNAPREFQLRWHAFVTSFCGHAESATHWLHYGRSGTGVAVAFDSKAIVQQPFELVKVVYDPDEQRKFIGSVIQAILNKFEALAPGAPANPSNEFFRVVAHLTAQAVWAAAPRFKSPAFASEEEWRLITYELDGVDFSQVTGYVELPTHQRTVGTRLVAYKENGFDRLPISEVILGWSCETKPDDYAISRLLQDIPISRSAVPIRP